MSNFVDTIIIGGGAAGLFTAAFAAKNGKKVLILEHNNTCGKKIRISGGGRCNFTNIYTTHENFLSENTHFCKSALKRYTPYDFIDLVERYKIAYHEKTLGQLFCDKSSQQIIDMLVQECTSSGVQILTEVQVDSVQKKEDTFIIVTSLGEYSSKNLVIATGGLSIPPLGATDFGYKVAKQFGHKIIPCVPALVPLIIDSQSEINFSQLSGISFDSIVSYEQQQFRENSLLTHKGVSGPAILQISSYIPKKSTITINILPQFSEEELVQLITNSSQKIRTLIQQFLPQRFVQTILPEQLQEVSGTSISKSNVNELVALLHHWNVPVIGNLGFTKAEVTKGGVSTKEISSKTMESTLVSGLFFVGEVMDVTGHLGGYNFQWAWSSGFACGTTLQ
ncbi:MAG: NAD(P)/FAD-dependent oxidoreductase [Candidatus Kapabacteria bacterium]|jgi:predicted Rossmann fold flavoprotein|nr:NAD(P)/FAD-dependent oxidoreductase [Candidatus Kapabacteria bacterium]